MATLRQNKHLHKIKSQFKKHVQNKTRAYLYIMLNNREKRTFCTTKNISKLFLLKTSLRHLSNFMNFFNRLVYNFKTITLCLSSGSLYIDDAQYLDFQDFQVPHPRACFVTVSFSTCKILYWWPTKYIFLKTP